VDSQFTPLLGDATVLDTVEGDFDLVLANISRNTLLADMDRFCQKLAHGGRLVLSGFYSEDKPLLAAKATSLGLHLVCEKTNGHWQCLSFS
jgi:ribosomal protein L11 methyltransferase